MNVLLKFIYFSFSVRLVDKKLYNTGEEITLQLMKREHGTTIATPVSELTSRTRNLLTIGESSFTTAYSKLLLANEKDVNLQIFIILKVSVTHIHSYIHSIFPLYFLMIFRYEK